MSKVQKLGSVAEDLFVDIFSDTFGPEKAGNLFVQYPFVDIYGNHRFIDFALESQELKIAIEIDGATYHDQTRISDNKYHDDLLKQNSMVFEDWKVYRWTYNQLKKQPEKVKDELITFLGETPFFKEFAEYLPVQQGKALELREYQQDAVDNLAKMREEGKTIALLYHATGVGKTVTACNDAKAVGGRTLFLVNALKLADQASETFRSNWPQVSRGFYTGSEKDKEADVLFATVQTMSRNLLEFSREAFDYIIVDECHHAASKTYQAVFSYFKPRFILGLSATPERADGEDLLELFRNVAHRMDLKTAVEQGILAPIRCLRIRTDVDLSDVRISGIKYDSRDLESKLLIPERNALIADVYVQYAKGKQTVVFCASVKHAEEIARLLMDRGVEARAVSGRDSGRERDQVLLDYEEGRVSVLCACDLLNEGWDSPGTEVLFMARPTMSRTIYMQQLGRGTRKAPGKEDLLVFDFVDNANLFNQPYSLHRVLDLGRYRPLEYVLAPPRKRVLDEDLFRRGEKPEAYIELPVNLQDVESVDLFDWQKEAGGMISQLELVRMVSVQKNTLDRYIREGRIEADMEVPLSQDRVFRYFKKESVGEIAKRYGWKLISPSNIREVFLEYVERMDMAFSYKPVLLLGLLEHCTEEGKVRIEDLVDFFLCFYEDRRARGLFVEDGRSIIAKPGYSRRDVERLIFSSPFNYLSQMNFVKRSKNVEWVEFDGHLFRRLTREDKVRIRMICEGELNEYYVRKM